MKPASGTAGAVPCAYHARDKAENIAKTKQSFFNESDICLILSAPTHFFSSSFALSSSMHVESVLGQHYIILPFLSKRGRQTYIQLVRLSQRRAGLGVVPQRVARLDPLDQRGKCRIQMRHILHIKYFPARLVHHAANVH